MPSNIITHIGRVTEVEPRAVVVAVEVDEACSRCSAKSACAMGNNSESRFVRIELSSDHQYTVGDMVEVAIRRSTGLVAILLCYVVPLFLLIAVLVGVLSFGGGEGVAALSALSATAVYYAGLALTHRHISKKIIFTIKNRE